jgi:mannose-6-phosphate isomerase-like protein (cupin superfamily)
VRKAAPEGLRAGGATGGGKDGGASVCAMDAAQNAPASPLVQRRGDDPREWTLYGGDGTVGIEWFFRERTRLGANVMLYHLEPGAAEGDHRHLEGADDSCSVYSSDEMYVVTRGEVVMVLDGEERMLRAGDAAYAPHGLRHGVRNDSAEPAELVLIFGPPRSEQVAGDAVAPHPS